jgi:hypothetical protein
MGSRFPKFSNPGSINFPPIPGVDIQAALPSALNRPNDCLLPGPTDTGLYKIWPTTRPSKSAARDNNIAPLSLKASTSRPLAAGQMPLDYLRMASISSGVPGER